MKPRLLIIANPNAGHGKAKAINAAVKASGIEERFNVEVEFTLRRYHAAELAKAAADSSVDVVAAAGGDGTVNEVASSLINKSSSLALIPLGSGNGLARHLQYPMKATDALKKIKNGSIRVIDSLIINKRPAFNVSGLGFDGYVASIFDKSGRRGLMTYTTITLQEYFRYKAVGFKVNCDGDEIDVTSHMVVIANASQFGNAAIIAPHADLQDGKADIIIVKRPPLHRLPSTFYRIFNGTLKPDNYTKMFSGKKISITASKPVHLHIDGEPCAPVTDVSIEVLPASLKVIS